MTRRRKKIQLPPKTTRRGKIDGLHMTVIDGGKPPKLRFRPGQFIEYKGQLHELMFAYRVKDDPHEWIFCLEERRDLSGRKDLIGIVAEALGCGDETPRILYDLLRDSYDAFRYFEDIPANGDRTHVRNKDLLQKGKVISSGEILSSKEIE